MPRRTLGGIPILEVESVAGVERDDFPSNALSSMRASDPSSAFPFSVEPPAIASRARCPHCHAAPADVVKPIGDAPITGSPRAAETLPRPPTPSGRWLPEARSEPRRRYPSLDRPLSALPAARDRVSVRGRRRFFHRDAPLCRAWRRHSHPPHRRVAHPIKTSNKNQQ